MMTTNLFVIVNVKQLGT